MDCSQHMLEEMIEHSVRHTIASWKDHWTQAIRYDFRVKDRDAISLLFHAAAPNRNYVGVYALDESCDRTGGKFPPFTSSRWRFLSDHDCAVRDAIRSFFADHSEKIQGWDWVDPFKIIPISGAESAALKEVRCNNHQFHLSREGW